MHILQAKAGNFCLIITQIRKSHVLNLCFLFLKNLIQLALMCVLLLCSDHWEKGHDYCTFLHVLHKTFHFSVSSATFWLWSVYFLFKVSVQYDCWPLLWLIKLDLDFLPLLFMSSVHIKDLDDYAALSPCPSLSCSLFHSWVLSEGSHFMLYLSFFVYPVVTFNMHAHTRCRKLWLF